MIEIYRFNPVINNEPRYDSYNFDIVHQPTILEVLRKVREENDNTLGFRESCGLGKCGSCAVKMNGKPVLACQTLLPEDENIVIEPLDNYKIVKDLVVDRSKYEIDLKGKRIFNSRPDYLKPAKEPFQYSRDYNELSQCIECLICQSTCPAYNHNDAVFPGPAVLVQLSRSLKQPHNKGNEEDVAWSDGIHNCTACMICEHVCPKGVKPFRNSILTLRSAINDKMLDLPTMQQGMSDQYTESGTLVPKKELSLKHQAIDEQSKTALFLGCMFKDRYPKEGIKILDELLAMDIKVRLLDDLVCCGGPLLWTGHEKDNYEAFEKNMEVLLGADVNSVITPCPGCSLILKIDYANLYKDKHSKELPFTIVNMTELNNIQSDGFNSKIDKKMKVAYHSPCHHGIGLGLMDSALDILETNPNIEILETNAINMCCGGMTSSSNNSMTFEMSSKIIQEAELAGADILVTTCVFCRDNILRAARRKKSKVKIEHLLLNLKNK